MDLNNIKEEKIKAIAEVVYPKETKKDIDGDWYDVNENNRLAFILGFKQAVEISNM